MQSDRTTLIRRLEEMLWELESQQLEVVLIPAPEGKHSGHCVRAVQCANPEWYQKFCAEYISSRRSSRPRTAIKRRETIHALENMIAGKDAGIYGERLLNFIQREYIPARKRAYQRPNFDLGF